jgi:hypothetical protein
MLKPDKHTRYDGARVTADFTAIEARKLALDASLRAQALALTERQIDAACCMWRDPDKWRLVPTGVGTRCLYARKAK